MKIKDELEAMALRLEEPSTSNEPFPDRTLITDTNLASTLKEKAKEISLDLKSITQLYNDFAVPFELWEVNISLFYLTLVCLFMCCPIFYQLIVCG